MNLLGENRGDSLEIDAEFQLNPAVGCFGFRVRVGECEQTTVAYDMQQQKVILDRSNSGESSFDNGFARLHSAGMAPVDGKIRLKIFVDRSSVEVFGNDGEVVLSDTIFPAERSQGLELFTQAGEISLNALDIYELRPANFTSSP